MIQEKVSQELFVKKCLSVNQSGLKQLSWKAGTRTAAGDLTAISIPCLQGERSMEEVV